MRWRTVRRVAATVFVSLLVPGAVAAVGIGGATGEIYTARDDSAPPAPVNASPAPVHDPQKPTAVAVLGSEGANAADVLAPYEVLAATGAFNVYTVAPQRQPVPLTGNLDLVPDLSFGQLDQRLPTGPEVIVVPQLGEVASGLPPSVAPVVQWLQRQRAEGDPLLVSVCVGAEVLASAGLLDGRPATSHWLGLIGLRRDYPEVRWRDGVTYVDDGDVITTAGVLSGVDGALRVVERMLGPAAAARAARAVEWPAYSPGRPALDRAVLSGPPGRGDRRRASGPVPARSDLRPPRGGDHRRARAGPAPGSRRRGGPTWCVADGLSLPEGLTPVYLHDQPGFAFDAALGDIARTRDVATARWVAKSLQHPTTTPRLSGPAWPWTLTLRPILIAAATVAVVVVVVAMVRRRHGEP